MENRTLAVRAVFPVVSAISVTSSSRHPAIVVPAQAGMTVGVSCFGERHHQSHIEPSSNRATGSCFGA
jgi:hypothetical protein